MKIKWTAVLTGTVLLLCGGSVAAHHSFSAMYDSNSPFKVEGLVTKIEWTNPHARFYVDVTDEQGRVVNWNFELASPSRLVRNGWKASSLKIGDKVKVAGYKAYQAELHAIASGVTAPDGRELFASTQADLSK